jgi:hypothetical protein
MKVRLMGHVFMTFLILIFGALSAKAEMQPSEAANTYYAARGFDLNGDGQVDFIDTGYLKLLAVALPGQSGVYLQSAMGGMNAPMAYYPDADERFVLEGRKILVGNGTFEQPQLGSALDYRTVLFSKTGANALRAWYTDAIIASMSLT